MHPIIHPFNHPSVHSPTHSFTHAFIHPPFHPSTIRPSTHPLIHLFAHPNNPLSIYSPIHPLVYTSIHPPIQTTLHLSVHSSSGGSGGGAIGAMAPPIAKTQKNKFKYFILLFLSACSLNRYHFTKWFEFVYYSLYKTAYNKGYYRL